MGFRNLNRSAGTPAAGGGGGGGGSVNSVGVANATLVKTGTATDPLFAVVQATVAPAAVGTQTLGTSLKSAKEDHVHAHGNQLGGSLHSAADGSNAGFMTAVQFTKLAGIASLAAALTAATPVDIGTAAVGVATDAARADHVHGHGNLAGGSFHAAVIAAGASGFMTGTDKTKLDGITAAAAAVGSSAGASVTLSAGIAGVATSAARSDHTHQLDVSISPAWTGVHTLTNAAVPLTATITDASGTAQIEAARFRHVSSVAGAAGSGVYVSFWGMNTSTVATEAGRVLSFLRSDTNSTLLLQYLNSSAMTTGAFVTSGVLYGPSLGIGTINATGTISTSATIAATGGNVAFAAAVNSLGGFAFSGTANNTAARPFFTLTPPSNTASTAATEINFFSWGAHTHQFSSNTALSNQREWLISAPTYAFATSGGVINDAATVHISGPPIAGTNCSITRAVALSFGAGQVHYRSIAITAAGGGSTATLGTIGGSGPTTATQAKWVPEIHDGVQYWRPVWL